MTAEGLEESPRGMGRLGLPFSSLGGLMLLASSIVLVGCEMGPAMFQGAVTTTLRARRRPSRLRATTASARKLIHHAAQRIRRRLAIAGSPS